MEVWKDIEGFGGMYKVSNLGRIYSTRTNKVLKQMPRTHGYLSVWLYGEERRPNGRCGKAYSVHRLVAEAFCERKDGQDEVNHKNEIKDDNRAENLEWCTHQENSSYGTRGERIGKANLNGLRSKAVYQYSVDGILIATYPSVQEVIRQNEKFSLGGICQAIRRPFDRKAYGYYWTH